MGLNGNLRTMDLPEILQWISGGRKTGTLHLERRSVQKRIAFKGGVIHTSWSNDPRESLGQFLIRERVMIGHALPDSAVEREALRLASLDKSLAEISLELRRSEFETASALFDLHQRGLVEVDSVGKEAAAAADLVGTIKDLLSVANQR